MGKEQWLSWTLDVRGKTLGFQWENRVGIQIEKKQMGNINLQRKSPSFIGKHFQFIEQRSLETLKFSINNKGWVNWKGQFRCQSLTSAGSVQGPKTNKVPRDMSKYLATRFYVFLYTRQVSKFDERRAHNPISCQEIWHNIQPIYFYVILCTRQCQLSKFDKWRAQTHWDAKRYVQIFDQ